MTLRWTFPDPGEAAARAEVDAAIDAWWQALASARDRLVPQVDQSFDLVGFVAQHLLTIHSNLKWELRPGASHRWCFVVTADEDRHLEPLVMRIASRAPPQLGFEVATQRAPESVSMALATVQGRFGVDASDWTVEFGPAQLGFLNVCWRGAASPEAAVCLMKCLVGERAVMDWVGNVDVARPSLRAKLFRGSRTGVSEFAAAFEAQRQAVWSARPARPLQRTDREGTWSVVELEPGVRQQGRMLDLVSAITPDVEFLQVILSGVPFSSERFSRFAERFIFVQVEVPPDEGVKLRMRVEDALDEALAQGDVGRTITGGTGARCAYVVLVVKDLEAVDSVRRALEGLGVPKATWIRFLDDSLSAEWVGVFPDTPPPSD